MKSFTDFINEQELDITEDIQKFSENRLKGATDITNNAQKKGGDAILTYYHFNVKLPYYELCSQGSMNMDAAKQELLVLTSDLYNCINKDISIDQIAFQEIVGKIEVLGELLIKNNEKYHGL